MTPCPLRPLQQQAQPAWMTFGPSGSGVEAVQSFGFYHAEYAAIRKGVAILHMPWRRILRFTGNDRKDFLHRMTTADIRAMAGGGTRRAFQLSGQGRILADILVLHGDVDGWIEADVFDLDDLKREYDRRLIADDVTIEDWREERRIVALHGPKAMALIDKAADDPITTPVTQAGTHHVVRMAGAGVTVYRHDECGVEGYRLALPSDRAAAVYERLALAVGGLTPAVEPTDDNPGPKRELPGRGIGWLAYNTARVEAGAPLFHIDFGHDCLPHETGILRQAVSFTKGCYLGQEIVARMEHLGHPKRILAGVKMPGHELPIAGTQVLSDTGEVVGAVTSSTLSPMLGNTAIALAMMKWGSHVPGAMVRIAAEGQLLDARVHAMGFV
ncbi:MAG: aminomethyl transferase family protein [Phycisphaeraceae bacterium]|nr:aminomethyl transferase family protein [Phycisphaeraceae bacterium]